MPAHPSKAAPRQSKIGKVKTKPKRRVGVRTQGDKRARAN